MNWYYAKDGQPAGPVDEAEFARLLASGAVHGATLVWHSDLPEWKRYADLHPASAPLGVPAIGVPAAAAPAEIPGMTRPYAGFWIRAVATMFDTLILMPPVTLLYIGFFMAMPDFLTSSSAGTHERDLYQAVLVILGASYETLFVGRFGRTPGKMICNLRILHPDGTRISHGRSLARYVCKGVSGLFFFAGYLLVAFTAEKCGFHDLACDTRVIHTD